VAVSNPRAPAPARSRSRRWTLAVVIAALATLPLVIVLLLPKPEPARVEEGSLVPPREPTRLEMVRRILFTGTSVTAGPEVDNRAPPAPVSGRILDPDGNPVAAAFVACDDRHPEIAANANGDGAFELPPSADGCRAVARARGFAPSAPTVLRAGPDNTI